jgi:hypothetical protein
VSPLHHVFVGERARVRGFFAAGVSGTLTPTLSRKRARVI